MKSTEEFHFKGNSNVPNNARKLFFLKQLAPFCSESKQKQINKFIKKIDLVIESRKKEDQDKADGVDSDSFLGKAQKVNNKARKKTIIEIAFNCYIFF